VLARIKRLERAERHADIVGPVFYWDTRAGGYSAFDGNAPEAFNGDAVFGLKPRDPQREAAQVRAISGVQS